MKPLLVRIRRPSSGGYWVLMFERLDGDRFVRYAAYESVEELATKRGRE